MTDPHVDVRQAAALCLSSIGWHVRDAVPVLRALLREDDPFMVTWAGDALEKIDPALIPERGAR